MSTMHVFPMHDWIEHRYDQPADKCDCPCNPRIEYINPTSGLPFEHTMVFHQVLDKELFDLGNNMLLGTLGTNVIEE